jgi:proteasome lid subunit RPN8/RPN11
LRIVRLIVPRQYCTEISVRFDDESLADEFENLAEAGYSPLQFARVWLHTHPGDSAHPSLLDEETFARKFSDPDWAVMGILARSGASYARLRWNAVPQFEIELAVEVDFEGEFGGSRRDDWDALYRERVIPERWFSYSPADEFMESWWIEAAERGGDEIF